jgi:hypothetical protein
MPDGDINDEKLAEYNIWELADKQAEFYQNRQVREREELEAKLAQRTNAVERPSEDSTDAG